MRAFLVIGIVLWLGATTSSQAATFGTVVTIDGGVSDLVLDEARGRLYLVNSPQNRVEIYDTSKKQLLSPVSTTGLPLSAAISADGQSLYVANYGNSTLDVIDLNSLITKSHVSLTGAPEGVAVGGDGRVLITTIGTTTSTNNLLMYDPSSGNVSAISIAPPAPASAGLAPASGRVYMTSRSHLESSRDGRYIVGMNNPTTTTRQVFVYEVASGSVLRSRSVTSISSVLSVSADGSKFMAGLTLFDAASLTVMAQQNAANSIYMFPANVNFNTQQNQGGSAFAPDGSALYTAFNIAPVQTPAAAADVSQLMVNDPDNLLINLALETPENLAGKMAITSDSAMIYAISQSGFLMLPLSTVYIDPVAATSAEVVLLTHDQCGVTAATQTGTVNIQNQGKGHLSVSATVQSSTATATTPALGGGRAGGGFTFPGLPIFIIGGPGGPGGAGGAGGSRRSRWRRRSRRRRRWNGRSRWWGDQHDDYVVNGPAPLHCSDRFRPGVPIHLQFRERGLPGHGDAARFRSSGAAGRRYPAAHSRLSEQSQRRSRREYHSRTRGHIDRRRIGRYRLRHRPPHAVYRQLRPQSRRSLRHAGHAFSAADQSRPTAALFGAVGGWRHALCRQYGWREHQHHRPEPACGGRQDILPADSVQRQLCHLHAADDCGHSERSPGYHVRRNEQHAVGIASAIR